MVEASEAREVDAVVIGAGFSGLYATKRLTDIGLSVRAFDAAEGVGGVWTWNRYPGARTDSLAEAYQFSFDREFVADWEYSNIHPEQSEVHRYLNKFADHFGLRRHYGFGTRVEKAVFDEELRRWRVTTDGGEEVVCQYFVTGLGLVSAPIMPDVPGIENFAGEVHHTSRWPERPVELAGKRVAVIGTGSSGVQVVSTIATEVAALTVYQRTANWCPPTGHRSITPEERAEYLANYDKVWSRVRQHPAGWPWEPIERLALETPAEERDAVFKAAWRTGGFSMLYETFADLFTDKTANDILCEWTAAKMRAIVDDPVVAEKLIPKHPYGAKRPPAADGYLEAFNLPHVDLVDLTETPITQFTENGILTGAGEVEVDVIIMATGFDAITGAFTRMDIRGIGGERLNDHWESGPETYLGLGIHGFPNLLMVAGPQSPFANLPPGAQEQGNWIADLIAHMREQGIDCLQPTRESELEWTAHLTEVAESLVTRYGLEANSWFAGANIEGKARAFNVYFGGHNAHADLCEAEAAAGYPKFEQVPVLARAAAG